MGDAKENQQSGKRLIDLLVALLKADFATVLLFVLPYVGKLFGRFDGIYEVLEYEAHLELSDATGARAIFTKRQRVRFLQNNVIAYQDQAWGDGKFLDDYSCSPGKAVDVYREGHKYQILISLRETKNRGDEEQFQIQRTITNGFVRETEDFQIEIDHPTRRLSMVIVFPSTRPPTQVKLIEQNKNRTVLLDPQDINKLPDGHFEVRWETQKLRLFEKYVIRWSW